MLPQYDDPVADEVQSSSLAGFVCACFCLYACVYIPHNLLQGLTLDASGRFTGEAERKLEEVIDMFGVYMIYD